MAVDVGAQLREGVVESCVLGLPSREPMYGWQLSEPLISSGMIASIGTLYPVLSRLRAQGLVSSYDQVSDAALWARTTDSLLRVLSSSAIFDRSGSHLLAPWKTSSGRTT